MIQPDAFLNSLSLLAPKTGFQAIEINESNTSRLIALKRPAISPAPAFRLYLSAGIHGDEPAGPLALQNLIEKDLLPHDLEIVICPLINPTGFTAGTRENDSGHDLNRDFRYPQTPEAKALTRFLSQETPFDLSICLHEDWESSGYYMYALSPDPDQTVSRKILKAVSAIGPIDLAADIDGSPVENGLIQRSPNFDIESRDDWPEAFYLYSMSPHPHFTTETPSSAPLPQRIEMQTTAVLAAIALLLTANQPTNSPE